jgi:D-alanine-D-alanine ligase
MDKAVMKTLFLARGLPVGAYTVVLRPEWLKSVQAVSGPGRTGTWLSGVRQAGEPRLQRRHLEGEDARDLMTAMELALQYDRKIVIEAAVANARRSSARCSATTTRRRHFPGEIIPSREFYDYEAKYLDESSKSVIPGAAAPKRKCARCSGCQSAAFRAVDLRGMARVDFFLDADRR